MVTREEIHEIYQHVKKIISQSLNGTVLTEQITKYIIDLLDKERVKCKEGRA